MEPKWVQKSIKIENRLNNRNAKNGKEPCTQSEPPRRNETSRCGGVASALSINSNNGVPAVPPTSTAMDS